MTQEQFDALPASVTVREVRRTVRRKGFRPITVTVITTLLDEQKYPAEQLIKLRMSRWGVEVDLRHLKTTMGMELLHCESVEGVKKELTVFQIVYNLVRVVMMEGARRQQVGVERISFADALAWVRHAQADDELPDLVVNPHRPDRIEPRAVKRRFQIVLIRASVRETLAIRGLLLVGDSSTTMLTGGHILRKYSKCSNRAELQWHSWMSRLRPLRFGTIWGRWRQAGVQWQAIKRYYSNIITNTPFHSTF
jgi:hypothetical protein